jgi:membrane protease YdiL (CAAX protease family)
VRAALLAIAIWITSEFLIRSVGIALVLLVLGWRPPEELPFRTAGLLNAALQWPALLVPLMVTLVRSRREGLTRRELGYRASWQLAGLGVLAGLAMGAATDLLATPLDERLFQTRSPDRVLHGIAAAGVPGAVVLLAGNGMLAPLVEEFVWRGYIQSRLTLAWPPWVAVAVTASFFAAKHVVVDLSLERTATLVTVSFILGMIAWRWGESSPLRRPM